MIRSPYTSIVDFKNGNNARFQIEKPQNHHKNSQKDDSDSYEVDNVANSARKQKFSPREDELLLSLVERFGPRHWDRLAVHVPGRTGRQCRDRYVNYLDPSILRREFSLEEDILLIQKVSEIGTHWSRIKVYFPGRTSSALKNRYYVSLAGSKKTPIGKRKYCAQRHHASLLANKIILSSSSKSNHHNYGINNATINDGNCGNNINIKNYNNKLNQFNFINSNISNNDKLQNCPMNNINNNSSNMNIINNFNLNQNSCINNYYYGNNFGNGSQINNCYINYNSNQNNMGSLTESPDLNSNSTAKMNSNFNINCSPNIQINSSSNQPNVSLSSHSGKIEVNSSQGDNTASGMTSASTDNSSDEVEVTIHKSQLKINQNEQKKPNLNKKVVDEIDFELSEIEAQFKDEILSFW